MHELLAFTFFIPFVGILFTPLIKEKSKRKKTVFVLLSVAVLSFILFGITDASKMSTEQNAKAVSPTIETPKPTSSDPCEGLSGNHMHECIQMQNAILKGQELQNPLKATITHDSYAVYVKNTEATEWDQCLISLDDENPDKDYFTSDGFIVKPGQTETVPWSSFANFENVRFNYFQTKPTSLDLECVVGGQTDPKTNAFTGGKTHRSIFTF